MRQHIRGNFGTQILQAALAVAQNPDDEPILCVNHGNISYDGTNKLNLLFTPKCRIIDIDTTFKTPYWVTGAAKTIFENRDKIFRHLVPKEIPKEIGTNAVHIRGKDKKMCSDENYKKLIELGENGDDRMCIFTDDEPYVKTLTEDWHKIYSEDFMADWIGIYNAGMIWAAPSSFVLCMLLFNPNKRVLFLGESYCDKYDVSKDMIFVREAMEYCPNMEILDDL